jgi:hypothetical protein
MILVVKHWIDEIFMVCGVDVAFRTLLKQWQKEIPCDLLS